MSVAEDTIQIPEVVASAVETAISNTFEAPKVVEEITKTILEESQAVIDETTKLIEEIATTMVAKNETIVTELVKDEAAKAIVSEGKAIVDETIKLVESAVKTAENIASIVSDEEKRLTETISRLSIEMEQEVKKTTGLFAKIHKFIKLITSCTHRADKPVVKVSTDDVNVNVVNVV